MTLLDCSSPELCGFVSDSESELSGSDLCGFRVRDTVSAASAAKFIGRVVGVRLEC